MQQNKILLVEDDANVRRAIKAYLEPKGFEVAEADSCAVAVPTFQAFGPDVTLMDYWLPDGNALELLARMKELEPAAPVIILTAHGSIELAVEAIKHGAEHFLTKPVELKVLLVVLQRILDSERNRRQVAALATSLAGRETIDPFAGTSPAIRALFEVASKVAESDYPVVIEGETGAGKGMLARWIHDHSPRSSGPFVDMNCAGLSVQFLESDLFGHGKGAFTGAVAAKDGLLEVAHRGTVFLDEIGDMDLQVQPKLLKVLEDKQFRRLGDVRDRRVDIRLIAASHENLMALVKQKRFRSDLYFRISTIPLTVPSLRDRREDIPKLAEQLLSRLGTARGLKDPRLSKEAQRALQAYPWPGNIRELRNVLERAVLLADSPVLAPKDLCFAPGLSEGGCSCDAGLGIKLDEVERNHIERVLRAEGDNVERAARRLGISRSTLYEKLKKYGGPSGN